MSASYLKPRSPKYLLHKARADLEAVMHASVHAREMHNRLYINTPKDVATNVATYLDVVRALHGALHK